MQQKELLLNRVEINKKYFEVLHLYKKPYQICDTAFYIDKHHFIVNV